MTLYPRRVSGDIHPDMVRLVKSANWYISRKEFLRHKLTRSVKQLYWEIEKLAGEYSCNNQFRYDEAVKEVLKAMAGVLHKQRFSRQEPRWSLSDCREDVFEWAETVEWWEVSL